MVTASARREQAVYATTRGLSTRYACVLFGTPRSRLYYEPRRPNRDAATRTALRELAKKHPRWGYRFMTNLLERRGERTNPKRVWRLWKLEGLCLPRRRARKRFARAKPAVLHKGAPNVVWACDFVHDRCADGRVIRCLTIIDEGTRESLAIFVRASLRATHVVEALQRIIEERGRPRFLRTDNGSEFTAFVTHAWLEEREIAPIFNEPGKPWQNGVNESFNGRFRDECLNPEMFLSRREAIVIIEDWRRRYNEERPHSALGYMTPQEARLAYLDKRSSTEETEGPAS
jgi:putative transposase